MTKRKKLKVQKNAEDITLDRVIASGILPTQEPTKLERVGANEDGSVWFKDTETGTCYKVDTIDEALTITLTRSLKKAKEEKPKRMTVTCEDCGDAREVATQDAFQVKRCITCQRKHRNRKRTERAKVRRAEARHARELTKLNGKEEEK